MGSETTLMTWEQLVLSVQKAARELREHEEYMKSKGFIITDTRVETPTGEIVWKHW